MSGLVWRPTMVELARWAAAWAEHRAARARELDR